MEIRWGSMTLSSLSCCHDNAVGSLKELEFRFFTHGVLFLFGISIHSYKLKFQAINL